MRAEGFIDKWGQRHLLTNKGSGFYWQMRACDLLTNRAEGFIDKWGQRDLLTNKGSGFYLQMRACDLLTNKGRGIYWEMRVGGLFAKWGWNGCIKLEYLLYLLFSAVYEERIFLPLKDNGEQYILLELVKYVIIYFTFNQIQGDWRDQGEGEGLFQKVNFIKLTFNRKLLKYLKIRETLLNE